MRVILYTGKGGVGKTSIAAATGLRLAEEGKCTLVLSTDTAHSLSDSFNHPLKNDPVPISDHLWGVEVNPLKETEKNWGAVQKWFQGVMEWADLDDITSEEMIVFPGMEELFSLLKIKQYMKSSTFDTIIVDCAPTGETLRLLSYPNLLKWWLEKIFPYEKQLVKVMRPVAKTVTGGLELPNPQTMDSIEQLGRELEEMHRLIFQSDMTSVRIVINPEKMVISEARRSFTYLNFFGFRTDAIVVNKIFPEEAGMGYFQGWHTKQNEYLQEIKASFSPIPILNVPFMQNEVTGLPSLNRVADEAFAHVDAGSVLYKGMIEEIKWEQGKYVLKLILPFITKDEVNVLQRGDELTILAGNHKRKVTLPRVLMGRPVTGARFVHQKLNIYFGDRRF
ncbi:ArsA family ATPase [Melghirimyces algeriensis]|uniref:arsenite-transporting ATPase n=1 Tax=Melghirimyces algeriensis TaxID=910412 RepID=A0A521CCW8_9BACL|nr:ArsA family ATPase [Melghirimyces algeriensis]SMO56651.1 arsenite efflux ATP-binding protein ArsA [Melghirimyces algeriensis]